MDVDDLARLQPRTIDEALDGMRAALEVLHAANDKRAIFVRLYYVMTLEVHAAINQLGDYRGRTVFLDPEWMRVLSGRFASLYFDSLSTVERPGVERAWKVAYRVAAAPGSTVVENALQGINAHINYDLPRAIAITLEPGDLDSHAVMQRRKFDHDQVNNLLVRVIEPIQDVLARDYEPGIAIADALLGRLDERMAELALKYYRERVWWDALAFAAARRDGDDEVVRAKLDWESGTTADALLGPALLWSVERVLNGLAFWQRPTRWADIRIEGVGGASVEPASGRRRATLLQRPNPRRLLKRPALPT